MAAVHPTSLQAFKPYFLASPGEPPIPWSRWIEMFDLHLLASGFVDNAQNADRKSALLKASLGVEGYRVYSSLTANKAEDYTGAVAVLRGHFDRQPSLFFLSAQFSRRVQKPGETVAQFVAALRELASKCEFGNALDMQVLRQFVAWVYDPKIRERLFQEPNDRTLDQMLTLATTLEQSSSSSNPAHAQ